MIATIQNRSLPIDNRSTSAGKVIFPLFLSFTAGTGGMMTAYSAEILGRWLDTPNIRFEPAIDTRSPAEHIANIRDVFEIGMSDLAAILGITRPTAYAWLKGDEPKKPEAVARIQHLSRIAGRVKAMNIQRMDKLIHRPILNGESLFDLLKTDKDLSALLTSLQEISAKEAKTRLEPKSSGKHLRSLDEVSSESGMPIDRGSC
jgi:hypothetical protein